MHQRALVVAALAVLASSSHLASADPKVEAKQHIDRASELHEQGKFAQALDELKTAFSLDPKSELLYAMGQIHVSLGQCTQAITYYERYLATKPDASTANAATEAISACKTNPPPPVDQPPIDQPANDKPPPPPETLPPPPTPAASASARPWYGDYIADGLVGAGFVIGIVGIVEYRSAVATRDRADSATSYQTYVDLVGTAHGQRTTAVVLGGVGVAAIAAGAVHYILTKRGVPQTVGVIPSNGGAIVTWAGKFR